MKIIIPFIALVFLCRLGYSQSEKDTVLNLSNLRVNKSLPFILSGEEAKNWMAETKAPYVVETLCRAASGTDSSIHLKIYGRSGIFYFLKNDTLILYKILITNTQNSIYTTPKVLTKLSSLEQFELKFPQLKDSKFVVETTTKSGKQNSDTHYFFTSDDYGLYQWFVIFNKERLAELYLYPECGAGLE